MLTALLMRELGRELLQTVVVSQMNLGPRVPFEEDPAPGALGFLPLTTTGPGFGASLMIFPLIPTCPSSEV
ncbi:hypothetical protein DWQ67_00005 [Galactobacter caseinivorans]|uniref:Uncharacterized protein n=1 Tax=Galactobacter caseinivorans TaxID=2676123 RepID=A0A496PLA5_9MICC|nr:hypothetical protein DWQ67_00005 [Galactobacter caseinivorans]